MAPPSRTKRRIERSAKENKKARNIEGPISPSAIRSNSERNIEKNKFLQSWVWKRESKPDKDRFEKPYVHRMVVPGGREKLLVIGQKKFKESGFASTVWDSSIVLAKYFEKWPQIVSGKVCLELGAGCGLVSLVLANLSSAHAFSTDMAGNLPLLKQNCDSNCDRPNITVMEYEWGKTKVHFESPLDVIVATDVLYDSAAVQVLVPALVSHSHKDTTIFLAFGRNRWAEKEFDSLMEAHFVRKKVCCSELDDIYQCIDVDVYSFRLRIE